MSEARSLNRRQFIRLGGLAASSFALGELTGACARKTRHSTRHESSHHVVEAPWSDLHTAISGRVVVPSDPDYSTSAILYNERFDATRPAAIAYCSNPSDVQRSIEFVRKWDVDLSVRSGGHSYGGYSTGRGLVIDVSPMSEVMVDQESARVGAGTRLIDMYSALSSVGVAVPAGSCPTVGIAGLALGGGIGVLGRKFGLSCDNVTSLQIATADGRILTCDASDNEDLYWASRGGGGGNFGVVISFDFAVQPLPQLALFTLEWPWAAAGEILGAWQEWIGPSVNELWSNCQLLSEGSGGTKVRVTGVFCGDSSTLSKRLQPFLRTVGAPSYQFVGPDSFMRAMLIEAGCEGLSVAQCHLPSQNAAGKLGRSAFSAKSVFIDNPLPSHADMAIVEAITQFQQEAPGLGGAVVFDAYGGAISEVPPEATAFVHREALADIELSVSWSAGPVSAGSQGANWLSQLADELIPYASGAYQNYIDPTLEDWASAYYGANLARLRHIKGAVDPDNIFRFAQSIPRP